MQSMTLFSGLALKDVLEDNFVEPFAKRSGATVTRVYEPTAVLFDLIRDGERPDVIIGVTASMHEMAAAGHVAAETIKPLVRSEVGVAVAAGTAVEPFSSVADFTGLLQRASAIAYSATGASGGVFQRVIAELGLGELVDGKAVVLPKGFTAETVRDGRADVAIQQISELATVDGVHIIGPLPAELEAHVELSIGIGGQAQDRELAEQFSDYLRSNEHFAVYEEAFLKQVS